MELILQNLFKKKKKRKKKDYRILAEFSYIIMRR